MRPRWSALLAIAVVPLVAACDSTAPNSCVQVSGRFDRTIPELVVWYRDGVDAAATTETLAARYGFTPIEVRPNGPYTILRAPQPFAVMIGLQCEPSVRWIFYNGHTYPA